MNLSILYTKDTPADRDIAYLRRRLEEYRIDAELLDADSRDGSARGQLYDVMSRPAVLLTDSTGVLLHKWEGSLPRVEDISPYFAAGR